jgi:hypothetical protein
MDQSSSSGVADSASYSAEYGTTNTSVTKMGGKKYRRSSRAGQMMPGRMSSRAGQMTRMSSRAGGRRRKMRKTRKAKKSHRRRR